MPRNPFKKEVPVQPQVQEQPQQPQETKETKEEVKTILVTAEQLIQYQLDEINKKVDRVLVIAEKLSELAFK